jgi:type I restriction enzyme S subunit
VRTELDNVVCGYHLAQIRPDPRIVDGEYLFRSFSAHALRDQFRVAATGITRYGLSKYSIDNALFPVPTLEEQQTIADFLDRETAEIDALVAKKRRLIELLEEKRTALISHATTKGLDPNVPMKDSGVEWLIRVPAHWEVTRLKHLTRQVTVGIVITPAKYYVDEGVPCLRSLNVRQQGIVGSDLVYI